MSRRFPLWILIALLPVAGLARANTQEHPEFDVTQLPLEQLLDTEFIPASRIARQISDAPSAVSVVTAQDIREFGYRSLSEILQSMRGLYVTSSLIYDTLGGRGFGHPGDYAGRLMLNIDGYTVNDNVFNQIFIGRDGLVDVELIERVEFIPGPGSTTYGNNAFLGVINVQTKRGRDFDGAQVGLGLGDESERQRTQRLTYGKQLKNGAEVLLSASRYDDDGRDARFPDMLGLEDHKFHGLKETDNRRLFFKGSYEGWSLQVAHARHALLGSSFFDNQDASEADHRNSSIDDNGFLSLKYDTRLSQNLHSSSHVYYGQYLFKSGYRDLDDMGEMADFVQTSEGRWWGADFKFVGTWSDQHKTLFGGEYRSDYKQRLTDAGDTYIDDSMKTVSLYAQDEYRLLDTLTLIPGFRFDHNSTNGRAFSPRFAAVYQPWPETVLKLSYGQAFRNRNPWETFFVVGSDLTQYKQEVITTKELVWQQQLATNSRMTLAVYHNRITEPVGQTYEALTGIGQEAGFEHITSSGVRLKANFSHQHVEDNQGRDLVNIPKWLGKFNIAVPLLQNRITAAWETQSIGSRSTFDSTVIDANTVSNLTLSTARLIPDASVSLSVRNLFDEPVQNVVDPHGYKGLRTLRGDGRNVWLQLEYNFR